MRVSRRANAQRRPTSVSAAGSLPVQMLYLDVHGSSMTSFLLLLSLATHAAGAPIKRSPQLAESAKMFCVSKTY